jgi:AcrR family transcriptional regulator
MSRKDDEIDPRVVRTRALLRQTLMQLVTEKSYANLTIQEITQRAGLNRSTFYLHYIGMHELLEDCAKDLFAEMRNEIYEKASQVKPENLEDYEPFVECVFKHLQQYLSFYRAMLGKNGDPYFSSLFQELLAELIFEPMRGEYHSDVESELILRFFTAGFSGIATWWLESSSPIPVGEAARLVTRDVLPAYMKLTED